VPVNGHQADSRLDQPPGQQAALAKQVFSIAVAELLRFAIELEGLAGGARGDQTKGLLVIAVQIGDHRTSLRRG
jgi:hypothetical protein